MPKCCKCGKEEPVMSSYSVVIPGKLPKSMVLCADCKKQTEILK